MQRQSLQPIGLNSAYTGITKHVIYVMVNCLLCILAAIASAIHKQPLTLLANIIIASFISRCTPK